jgi:hypothetical protein
MVKTAGVVLAIIGPRWMGPWVEQHGGTLRRELSLALRAPDTPVIPVLVGGAELPSPEELPDDLAPLLQRNAIALSDERWQYDVERLIDSIDYWFSGAARERLGRTAAEPELA